VPQVSNDKNHAYILLYEILHVYEFFPFVVSTRKNNAPLLLQTTAMAISATFRDSWFQRDVTLLRAAAVAFVVINAIAVLSLLGYAAHIRYARAHASRAVAARQQKLSEQNAQSFSDRLRNVDMITLGLSKYDALSYAILWLLDCIIFFKFTPFPGEDKHGTDRAWHIAFLALAGITVGVMTINLTALVANKQIALLRYLVTRFSKRRDRLPMQHYIPFVRTLSCMLAVFWACATFGVIFFRSPLTGGTDSITEIIVRTISPWILHASQDAWEEAAKIGFGDTSSNKEVVKLHALLLVEQFECPDAGEDKKKSLILAE